jgi:hypothetical protein
MQARAKRISVASILTCVVALAGTVLSGCHTAQKRADPGSGEVCPVCQAEIRTIPLTDLTYTICVCPECRKVSTLDSSTRVAVEAYVGGPIGETVHVCDACGTLIERCAVCREK